MSEVGNGMNAMQPSSSRLTEREALVGAFDVVEPAPVGEPVQPDDDAAEQVGEDPRHQPAQRRREIGVGDVLSEVRQAQATTSSVAAIAKTASEKKTIRSSENGRGGSSIMSAAASMRAGPWVRP